MTVYIDIILLENIIMNYIILSVVFIISKLEIKPIRIFISSVIGGLYVLIEMFGFKTNILIKIFLSVLMIYIAINPKKLKMLLKQLLIFYLVSFTLGGVSLFLISYIKNQKIRYIKTIITGGIFGAILLIISFKITKSKLRKKDMFCDIEIYYNNQQCSSKAFIDTGNSLKDPINHMPVIITQKSILTQIIPIQILNNIENFITKQNDANLENIEEYISRFRVIPFSSIGKKNGILLGFRPDKLKIVFQQEEKDMTNVLIGIYNETFTKNSLYTSLVGIDILEGGQENYEYFGKIKN